MKTLAERTPTPLMSANMKKLIQTSEDMAGAFATYKMTEKAIADQILNALLWAQELPESEPLICLKELVKRLDTGPLNGLEEWLQNSKQALAKAGVKP
jgi:hypothetical protein